MNVKSTTVFALLAFCWFAVSLCDAAPLAEAEVLADLVRESARLRTGPDIVVEPSWHWIEGQPVQCLRLALRPGSTHTTLIVRFCVPDVGAHAGTRIECIGAWANAEHTKRGARGATVRLVVNGKCVCRTRVPDGEPVYSRILPTINAEGAIELSCEITYDSTSAVAAVDWILPAVFRLRRAADQAAPAQLYFGSEKDPAGAEALTWRISSCARACESITRRPTEGVIFKFQPRVSRVYPRAAGMYMRTPLHLVAEIVNDGWRESGTSGHEVVELVIDEKLAVMPDLERRKSVPPVPAGGKAEVEWTLHPHRHVSVVSGQVVFADGAQTVPFAVPLGYDYEVFAGAVPAKEDWRRITSRKAHLIAYDWTWDKLRLRFIQNVKGVDAVRLAVRQTNGEYVNVADLHPVAQIDVITPAGRTKTINFTPRRVQFTRTPAEEVVLRGWAFDPDTGGWRIEQHFIRMQDTDELKIVTEVSPRDRAAVTAFQVPVVHVVADVDSLILLPGYRFEHAILPSRVYPVCPWILSPPSQEYYPLAGQLIPFVYAGGNVAAVCLQCGRHERIGNGFDLFWRVTRDAGAVARGSYAVALAAVSEGGTHPHAVHPGETLRMEASIKIADPRAEVSALAPDMCALGVIPRVLVNAERQRLTGLLDEAYTNYLRGANHSETRAFLDDEPALRLEQAALLWMERAHARGTERLGHVDNRLKRCIREIAERGTTAFVNTASSLPTLYGSWWLIEGDVDKLVEHAAQEAARYRTAYDWMLSSDVSGEDMSARQSVDALARAASRLLIAAALSDDQDGVWLATRILTKLRDVRIPDQAISTNSALRVPSLRACADLVEANVQAYRLTVERTFLDEAKRRARTGLLFLRRTSGDISHGTGMAVGLLGEHRPWQPLVGHVSPRASLLFADALHELADVDAQDAARWQTQARLLTQAVRDYYVVHAYKGCMPEAWDARRGVPLGRWCAPDILWMMLLREDGFSVRPHARRIATWETRDMFVTSVADVAVESLSHGQRRFALEVSPLRGDCVRLIVTGCPTAIKGVSIDDSPIAESRDPKSTLRWYCVDKDRTAAVLFLPRRDETRTVEFALESKEK